jgi:hypothetical protein
MCVGGEGVVNLRSTGNRYFNARYMTKPKQVEVKKSNSTQFQNYTLPAVVIGGIGRDGGA